MKLRVRRPGREDMLRDFKDRSEAARFGVMYYLVDNGHASRTDATLVARRFRVHGYAKFDRYTFTEVGMLNEADGFAMNDHAGDTR